MSSAKYPKTEKRLKNIVKELNQIIDNLDKGDPMTTIDNILYENQYLAKAGEWYIDEYRQIIKGQHKKATPFSYSRW